MGGAEQDQSPQLIWPVPAPETLVPGVVNLAYKPMMTMAKLRREIFADIMDSGHSGLYG